MVAHVPVTDEARVRFSLAPQEKRSLSIVALHCLGTTETRVQFPQIAPSFKNAGLVQWQNTSFPNLIREFDSLIPLKDIEVRSRAGIRIKPMMSLCTGITRRSNAELV